MSKYFGSRTECPVEIKGKKHTFYIRELGYLEFEELRNKAVTGTSEGDKERTGLRIMDAVVVASVEEEDGTASYTADEWRKEIKDAVLQLGKAAMKVQGIDVDAASEPLPAEAVEGNALPSRKFGTS
jgi:hypothetical protein